LNRRISEDCLNEGDEKEHGNEKKQNAGKNVERSVQQTNPDGSLRFRYAEIP